VTATLLGYAAGWLAVLSPCVLPLVPIVLGSALDRHRLAPLALAAGLAASFAGLGILVALVGFSAGLDAQVVRTAGALLMVAFGAILLSGSLQLRFATAGASFAQPLSDLAARFQPQGVAGHFGLGALLGAVWAPCTGPALGAALGLAGQAETAGAAAGVMTAFALGAASPLVLLAYGSRGYLATRRQGLATLAARAKPVMGAALLTVGLLALTGLDKALETELLRLMPSWWVELTTSI